MHVGVVPDHMMKDYIGALRALAVSRKSVSSFFFFGRGGLVVCWIPLNPTPSTLNLWYTLVVRPQFGE